MPPLYVTTQGAKLSLRNRRLVVEKDGEEIAAVPAVHVEEVIVLGNVSLTTPALTFLLDQGIDVVFLTVRGRYRGRLVGPTGGNGLLRLRQYERVSDPEWALETARAIVKAKLHNYRTLLRRYGRRRDACTALGSAGVEEAAEGLTHLIVRADACRSVQSLIGVEGQGTAIYFSVFRYLIRAPGWTFEKRTRRPPRDPVNALLSFGYTLLTHRVESAVRAVGLDPYLGVLHQVAYNRPSLALDLVEPFRPVVVDSLVLRCLNNRIVLPDHFRYDPKGPYPVLLNEEGRERFIRAFEGRMGLTFRHPVTGERITYRRSFEIEARLLARSVQTGGRFRPFRAR